MGLLDALQRGWWSGWAEFPELISGGAGLLESLIPGDRPDDPLERLQEWGEESAKGLRLEGGGGRSEGLLEKIAEGLGAAPGTLASMAPFMFGGGAVAGGGKAAATLGGRILGPALGFGAHGLVRHGDEGLPTAVGHGLKGAAEGAVFGGIGAWAGGKFVSPAARKLLEKRQALLAHGGKEQIAAAAEILPQLEEAGLNTLSSQLKRKGLHGAGVGGFIGGMTAAHGGDLEESVAAGTTMGLLGLLSRGKYHEPGWKTERKLAEIYPEAKEHAAKIEAERAAAEVEVAKEIGPKGGKPISVEQVARESAPYESKVRTEAFRKMWDQLEPEAQRKLAQEQVEHGPHSYEMIRAAVRRGGLDEQGREIHKTSDLDVIETGDLHNKVQAEKASLIRQKILAEDQGNHETATILQEKIDDLALKEMTTFAPVSANLTSAGRVLRAGREFHAGSPDWVEVKAQLKQALGPKVYDQVKNLAVLSEGNPELLSRISRAVNTPKMWDYMMEYWINGLLSGPTTQAVNVSSNALRQVVDHLEKRGSLLAESKFGESKLTRTDRGMIMGADFRVSVDAIMQLPKFLRAAFSEAKRIELIEGDPRMEAYAQRTKLDHPTAAIPGKAGSFIRIPGNMLQVMDLYFKGIAGQRAAAYTSYRKAYEMFRNKEIKETEIEGKIAEFMGEGKEGGEPAQFVLDAMKKEAEIQTFTERITHPAGKLVAGLREVPVRIPILGFEAKPGTLVVPFWQTPWNVVMQSIARSPIGLLRWGSLKRRYESKELTPQEYYKEVTATVMGTAVWGSLLAVAKMGGLTGGGPANYADKQNLLATGWRPYSVKIGDVYWQMQRLEPLGTVLGLAADAAEFGASDDKTSKAIAIVKDNMTDKSFLYGLESFAKAFANPEQFGSTYYRQMAGSIVPTFFSKVAQAVDPYQRIQEPLGATAGVPDALAYRIPGVSKALPERTTALGEKAERWGVLSTDGPFGLGAGAIQSVLSPLPLSAERADTEVEKEFNRLRGYQGMPPTPPRRTKKMVLKGVTGEDVKLTDAEYEVYNKYHQRAKRHLSQMISSPRWASIPDPMKAKMMRSVYDKYRSAANKEITVSIRRRTSVGE